MINSEQIEKLFRREARLRQDGSQRAWLDVAVVYGHDGPTRWVVRMYVAVEAAADIAENEAGRSRARATARGRTAGSLGLMRPGRSVSRAHVQGHSTRRRMAGPAGRPSAAPR